MQWTCSNPNPQSDFGSRSPGDSGSLGRLGSILTASLASCGFKLASRRDRHTCPSYQAEPRPCPRRWSAYSKVPSIMVSSGTPSVGQAPLCSFVRGQPCRNCFNGAAGGPLGSQRSILPAGTEHRGREAKSRGLSLCRDQLGTGAMTEKNSKPRTCGLRDSLSGIQIWSGSRTTQALRTWTKELVPLTFRSK